MVQLLVLHQRHNTCFILMPIQGHDTLSYIYPKLAQLFKSCIKTKLF